MATGIGRARLLGLLLLAVAVGAFVRPVAGETSDPIVMAGLERAKALELAVPEPPPGDRLLHEAGAYARVMCSAVFITGLDPAFAAEHVGYFTAPYAARAMLGQPEIDWQAKTVSVALPDGRRRVAAVLGSQGCLTFPVGETSPRFKPEQFRPRLPAASSTPWPLGDRLLPAPWPRAIDRAKLFAAVDAAFEHPESETAAVVVTWKGRLLAERYARDITPATPLESWSMGKSVTAALMGVLITEGAYDLWQPAPVPEWQQPGDPRQAIRIADLLRMSSGLGIVAPYDPDYDPGGPYPGHLYLYTGDNAFGYAASRTLQYPVNRVGRYRNTDPVVVNYLIRRAVERRHGDYLRFPQRALFDRIGVRSMVIETDADGDLLTQGYDLASGRDWARLGNLFLNDGVADGRRLLPKGYSTFVSSAAPAWLAQGQPVYGGFFWLNGDGGYPLPKSAYYMAGAGAQYTFVVPTHDLVVVRLGHFKGEKSAEKDLARSLELLMQAVPPSATDRSRH